jgi:putative MATE family efflux protein
MTDTNTAAPKQPVLLKDWTQGSVVKNMLQLSWPMIVMEATYMVSQIFDMVWVGRAGASSIAGLGIANIVFMMISTVDMGLIAGTRAMIARFVGEGNWAGAKQVAAQTLIMAAVWGAIVLFTGSLLAKPILGIFGADNQVVSEGMKYLRVLCVGWIFLEIMIMSLYMMQSTGDSIRPMIIEIIIRTVHLLVCPFLVLGLWFFPKMGISGAALSNVISQGIGAVLVLWLLFSGRTRLKLSWCDIRFIPNMAWRLLKIGFPSFLSMMQMNLSMFVVTWILVPFGTIAIAANSVVSNVMTFVMTPNFGLGSGVGVLVGQNLGSKQPERAVKTTLLGAGVLQGFLVVCGIIILIWAEGIVTIFSQDAEVIKVGAEFLRISTTRYST